MSLIIHLKRTKKFFLVNFIFLFFFSTPVYAQTYEWWNSTWYYRIPIQVNSTDYERINTSIEVKLNFTSELETLGVSEVFDNQSVRVIEYDSSGGVLQEVPSQFDEDQSYNASTNAIGVVTWIMNGTTLANTKRYYFIYFDTIANPKPAPNYATSLTYSWDGEEFWLNNSLRAFKVDTLRGESTSGIYYVTNYTVDLFNRPPSERTVEYIQLSNGTSNFMYDFRQNASFKAGPVKITVIQEGEEALWNNPAQKTGKAKMIKKYIFYDHNPWVKIQQQLIAYTSITRMTSQITALALDVDRAFGIDALSGNSADPYSWQSAYSFTGKGLGVINSKEENTTNYYASGSLLEGRIGITLGSTTLVQNESIFEEAIVYFNDKASHQPVQDLRNRTANPVKVMKNLTETYSVEIIAKTDYNFYNRNETAKITATISLDTHNLTSLVNATLDMGTSALEDDLTLILYDDATHGDEVANDSVYTNIYTFSTLAVVGIWNVTVKALDSTGVLLQQNWTIFNLTDRYNVNLTISNPSGITNRTIYANLTLKNYRNDTGVESASIVCQYDSTPVINISDKGNGLYSINFTAPSTRGTWNLSCNASKYNNSGSDWDLFYTEEHTTILHIDLRPDSYTVYNITQTQNQTFEMNVTLNNTGNGTAYLTNITLHLPTNWTANSTFEECGDIPPAGNCTKYFRLTVPAGTSPENYTVNATAEWQNPDLTLNSSQDQSSIIVVSNPVLEVVEEMMIATVEEGIEKKIGNFTVNSTGNDKLENISFTCISGEVCQNFTLEFNPSFLSNLSAGNWVNISVNVSVPEGYPAGNYSGLINVTSDNDGFDMLNLNVTVPESKTWLREPATCQKTVLIDSYGVVCEVRVNNTGNMPINFTITPESVNYTWVNETNFTVQAQQSHLFQIDYNTTNASQGIYYATYTINATTLNATPSNQTIFITLEVVFGPVIVSLTTEKVEQLETIKIIANITDRSGSSLNWVKANVTKPDTEIDILSLTNTTPNTPGAVSLWEVNYSNTSQRGVYQLLIYSQDNSGGFGQASDSFKVYAKLNITLKTGFLDYFAGESASIYYNVTDGIGSPLMVNTTITLYDSLNNVRFNNSYQTNPNGTLDLIPSFQIPSDAPLGNYTLKSFTSFDDPIVNLGTNESAGFSFGVFEKYSLELETAIVWYPEEIMKFYVLLYTTNPIQGPSKMALTVYDPAENLYLQANKSDFTIISQTETSLLYRYQYAMPPTTPSGYYLAVFSVMQGCRETKQLKSFRVSRGGPYDVVITSLTAEVEQGGTQNFDVLIENMGDVSQDVTLDYWISRNNITYASVSGEAVFIPAASNRTISRSLPIYSNQPVGEYYLNVRVTYSNIQPPTHTNRTFRVIEAVVPPAPPVILPPVVALPAPVYEIEILNVFPDQLDVERGGIRYVVIEVKNVGNEDLHKVSVYFEGIPKWFEAIREISVLKPESVGYLLVKFDIPKDVEPKVYLAKLKVLAQEAEVEKSYKIEIFESKEKLLEAKIRKTKKAILELETRAARIGEEGGDITKALRLLETVNEFVVIAEDYLKEGKLMETTEALEESRNMLEEVSYLLSIAKPVKPKIIFIPMILIWFIIILIIGAFIITFLIKKKPKLRGRLRKVQKKEIEEKDVKELLKTIEEQYKAKIISKKTYEELKKKYEKA
ncbi:MAG: NEW3 domain-containing protein [Candidatus Aenigmarchaeota archaeon]|nr:NEW3 domain-containing protein [Candidatus Aenigmarchaeota archaeon]